MSDGAQSGAQYFSNTSHLAIAVRQMSRGHNPKIQDSYETSVCCVSAVAPLLMKIIAYSVLLWICDWVVHKQE
jgi:hypothetical protein